MQSTLNRRNDTRHSVGLILMPKDSTPPRLRSNLFSRFLTNAKRLHIRLWLSLAVALTVSVLSQSAAAQSTFTNSTRISVLDLFGQNQVAGPYPSNISVSGLSGSVSKVTVILTDLNFGFPKDVDILLAGPNGQRVILMSDARDDGTMHIINKTLTFDDAALLPLPSDSTLTSGTYKPTNFDSEIDFFPTPAPAAPYGTTLSVFNGTNPNGTWSLYMVDDLFDDPFGELPQEITGGWSLTVTTQATPTQRVNGKIAFVSYREGNSEIYVMNPDGSDQKNITHNSAFDGSPGWSPDGRKIAFSSNRDGSVGIYVMNADGTGVRRLTYDLAENYDPDWSPDGTKIAFTTNRVDPNASGRGNRDIYVINADGSNEVRLTNDPSADFDPDWSPDGTRIAFTSDRDAYYQIYVMNVDGTGQSNITKNQNRVVDNLYPDWSPHGAIVFGGYTSPWSFLGYCDGFGPCGLFVMNPDGSGQNGLGQFYGESPVWSPDGTRIAYVDYSGFVSGVSVMNRDGSNRTRLNEDAFSPAWQPLLAASANPIDDAQFFVRQQYRDFLNREADPAGEDFWTDNITKCMDPARRPAGQTEEQCTLRQRETTSAAFFLSPEFQYTGYFVYRMFVGGLGRQPKLSEFTSDAQFVGAGIVVNGQLSGAKINQNKAEFAQQFVNCTDPAKYRCAEFKAIYDGLSNQQYVDKLFQTTGVAVSDADKAALVSELNANPATGRASLLQKVVDGIVVISEGNQQFTTSYGQAFYNSEFNRAFVQLQYFGYLKRDPDDAGYAHWLGKLNLYGNFVDAEMVLAFISSPEYRARFGQP